MRISDGSSDVCSSDLPGDEGSGVMPRRPTGSGAEPEAAPRAADEPPGGDRAVDLAISVEDARWQDLLPEPDRVLEPFVRAALEAGGGPAEAVELGIVLADDDEVRRPNRDYRGKDSPTNVLSFALTEGEAMPDPGGPGMLGD